jgi:hypothetical protein
MEKPPDLSKPELKPLDLKKRTFRAISPPGELAGKKIVTELTATINEAVAATVETFRGGSKDDGRAPQREGSGSLLGRLALALEGLRSGGHPSDQDWAPPTLCSE